MIIAWIEDDGKPKVKFEGTQTPDRTLGSTPSTVTGRINLSLSRSISGKSSYTNTSNKPVFHQVSGELAKNLAFLADNKPIVEIESDLYDLTREYKKIMGSPRIRLDSIRHIHHLMQMQEHFYDLAEPERRGLQRDIESLLKMYPWALNEYRWYLKLIGLMNILAVKWEIINPHRYAYRNMGLLPTNSVEATEHARRQTMAFTVDTLWLAVTCTMPPLCDQIDEDSQAFSGFLIGRFIGLSRYLMSLNYNADFYMYKSIKGFCGLNDHEAEVIRIRKKREKKQNKQKGFSVDGVHELKLPQYAGLITSEHIERAKRGIKLTVSNKAKKMRVKLSATVGFHLLELPANFCKCMNSKFDAVNLKLRDLLTEFEEMYRLFEYSTCKPEANLPMNSLKGSSPATPDSMEEPHDNRTMVNEFNHDFFHDKFSPVFKA